MLIAHRGGLFIRLWGGGIPGRICCGFVSIGVAAIHAIALIFVTPTELLVAADEAMYAAKAAGRDWVMRAETNQNLGVVDRRATLNGKTDRGGRSSSRPSEAPRRRGELRRTSTNRHLPRLCDHSLAFPRAAAQLLGWTVQRHLVPKLSCHTQQGPPP